MSQRGVIDFVNRMLRRKLDAMDRERWWTDRDLLYLIVELSQRVDYSFLENSNHFEQFASIVATLKKDILPCLQQKDIQDAQPNFAAPKAWPPVIEQLEQLLAEAKKARDEDLMGMIQGKISRYKEALAKKNAEQLKKEREERHERALNGDDLQQISIFKNVTDNFV
jgi:hypothetical protein